MRYQSWFQWLVAAFELLGTLAVVCFTLLGCLTVFFIQLAWWLFRLPFDLVVKGWRYCCG